MQLAPLVERELELETVERLLAGARAGSGGGLVHGLYWLTSNLADAQPLLVTVDDAHSADVASLRWLIYLARRLTGMPLALVLAARTAEPGPVQDLLDELLVIA